MFRTELTIAPQERQFSRSARVLTLGSCFADSMGERLRLNKVTALVNPFGTVFQPLALAKLLRTAAGETQDWQQHVVEARGRWQSYDFHGTVGADSPVELLQVIEQTVRKVGDFLRGTDLVVLTLGTAWAYRLRGTDELVSNLHKLPAGLFTKELLTADEIVNGLAEVHALLRRLKPDVRIVLTVSPVRHLKDTLPLNAVSKSVLRVACHYLSELLPGVSYFPAYELLNDDLRDYRYYGADMLHPTEVAEEYVWDKFARTYFDADFGRFRKEWAAVRQSLTHRPLHLGAPEHRSFLDQTAERLERLVSQGVEVRQELRDVQRQLAALPPPRPVRALGIPVEDDGEERIDVGGEDAAPISLPLTSAAETLASPAEHQREGRNRRGRGRGRDREQDRRSEQRTMLAPDAGLPEAQLPEATDEPLEEVLIGDGLSVDIPTDSAELTPENAPADSEEGVGYPAKKKKRRSRGGAKRTARKNAARLAAEQTPADFEALPIATETGIVDAGPAEELSLLADLPADELTAEQILEPLPAEASETRLAPEPPEPMVELAAEATDLEVNDLKATDPEVIEEPMLTPNSTEPATAEPTEPVARKRGTGPTPKRSKVITKSSQVKRPKRTSLFRNTAPANRSGEEGTLTAPETAAPAQAPVISTPILPEALLERPAVAELVENTAALAAVGAESAETPVAPTKPRRGRPKAATAPVNNQATKRTPVPAEATAPPDATASAPARPKRTAKSKTTSPAAPRRGRPPGKQAPPPAGEDAAS